MFHVSALTWMHEWLQLYRHEEWLKFSCSIFTPRANDDGHLRSEPCQITLNDSYVRLWQISVGVIHEEAYL